MKREVAAAVLTVLAIAGTVQYKANEETTIGKFHETYQAVDQNGNENTYYNFKSNDNEVWWALTAEEIGFVPNGNKEYKLKYNNNGTTKENKPCDCPFLCECEVYDDELISVKEVKGK